MSEQEWSEEAAAPDRGSDLGDDGDIPADPLLGGTDGASDASGETIPSGDLGTAVGGAGGGGTPEAGLGSGTAGLAAETEAGLGGGIGDPGGGGALGGDMGGLDEEEEGGLRGSAE